jgi:hypothetical protein
MLGHSAMESRIEAGDVRYVGKAIHCAPHYVERRRQVHGREGNSVFELHQDLRGDGLMLSQSRATVNDPMSNRARGGQGSGS